jgi:hypothetical protein
MLTGLSFVSVAWLMGMSPAAPGPLPTPAADTLAPAVSTESAEAPSSGTTPAGAPDLVLFVYPTSLSAGTVRELMSVGTGMLTRSGLRVAWIDCVEAPAACMPGVDRAAVVRFTTGASWRGDGCGWAVRRPGSAGRGLVSLDIDCVNEFAVSLRNRSDRVVVSPPRLMGALLAHEVAHIVGLSHGAKGLMGCHVGVAEWRALVSGQLEFSAAERRHLAGALREAEVVASR